MMIVRCDDQALYLSDLPVQRVHLLTAAHRHLAQRERVLGHRRCGVAGADDVAVGVIRHRHRLIGRVSGVTGPGQELDFFGDLEQLELGRRTAETELAGRGRDQVERNQPAEPARCFGSTTRWVTVCATGFTTTLVTAPHGPSVQETSVPIVNCVGSGMCPFLV